MTENNRRKEDKVGYRVFDMGARALITAGAVVTAVGILGGYLWASKDDVAEIKTDIAVMKVEQKSVAEDVKEIRDILKKGR